MATDITIDPKAKRELQVKKFKTQFDALDPNEITSIVWADGYRDGHKQGFFLIGPNPKYVNHEYMEGFRRGYDDGLSARY